MKKKRSLRARRSSFLSITSVPDLPAVTAPSADHGPSTATAAVLTSKELNLLVFRYLSESGFTHAAFNLGYEAGIDKTDIDGSLIPPNALVTIVQKGLQYIELEADPECGDTDDHHDLSLLSPWDLITKSFSELQIIIKEKKEKLQTGSDVVKEMSEKDKELLEREKVEKAEKDKDGEPKVQENKDNARIPVVNSEGKSKGTGIADGDVILEVWLYDTIWDDLVIVQITVPEIQLHGFGLFLIVLVVQMCYLQECWLKVPYLLRALTTDEQEYGATMVVRAGVKTGCRRLFASGQKGRPALAIAHAAREGCKRRGDSEGGLRAVQLRHIRDAGGVAAAREGQLEWQATRVSVIADD
ncbi:hypothetical protein AXF42_Ash012875 [Apostasia shenzhenica]|uniref:Uncharacterized protein n=1 Tax=Apostasia shenzhenica TaxID=1088818 RepID=A0A2I0ARI7_9ASPA|nr:hypothetical protein AXF42_Ash012875 [Apostasia shenzhenica]